jgi:AsmA protein
VVGVAVLAGVALAAVLAMPPVDLITSRAVAEVERRTGRTLTVAGPVRLSLWPVPTLAMADVTLAGADRTSPPLAAARAIEARLAVWPLVSGRFAVDQLRLVEPVVTVTREVDLAAWTTGARTTDASRTAGATAGATAADAADPLAARLGRGDLDTPPVTDLRIERGTLDYRDAVGGQGLALTDVDATVTMASLAGPLTLGGAATYRGEPVTVDLTVTSPETLIARRTASVRLSVKGTPSAVTFDGTVTRRPAGVALDGAVDVRGGSLSGLARLLGAPLLADGYGQHTVKGTLAVDGSAVRLTDATFAVGGATATGSLALDRGDVRPTLTADLRMDALDFPRVGDAARRVGGPDRSGDTRPGEPSPRTAAGWSRTPFALDGLGRLDVEARLTVGRMRWRDVETGAARLTARLADRVLRVAVDDLYLYDGTGRGVLTVDATRELPAFGLDFTGERIAGQRFLKDTIGFDLVSGSSRIGLALTATGASEAAVVESLTGRATLAVANGAVWGYDVAGAVRAIQKAQIPSLRKDMAARTEFGTLTVAFTIADGIATSQDLQVQGPLVRMTGAGQIALPARTVDYTLRPRPVSLDGQGTAGADRLAGLELPVRIRGPLADPEVKAEYGALVKNPQRALDAVREVGRQLDKSGKLQGAIDKLIGKAEETGALEGGKVDGKKLIEGLIKRPKEQGAGQ